MLRVLRRTFEFLACHLALHVTFEHHVIVGSDFCRLSYVQSLETAIHTVSPP